MSAKQAHDLGKPNIWALWPLMPIRLVFSEGQAHQYQYRRVPNEFGQDLHIGRWVIRLGLISIAVFGIVSYRSFAGPWWSGGTAKPQWWPKACP